MIVLLPGWAGFRSSLMPLEWRLESRLGDDVFRLAAGFGMGCIREAAEGAGAQIEELANERPGCRIDVIGHSMGGLIAAYLLKRLEPGRHLRSVITLGTPHRGSPAALVMQRFAGRFSPALAQMMPDSDFLKELARAPVPPDCQLISIAAANDTLVPPLYAQLPRRPRQSNRRLAGVSHLGLLNSNEVVDEITRMLERMRTPRPAPRVRAPELRPAAPLAAVRDGERPGLLLVPNGARWYPQLALNPEVARAGQSSH